MSLPPRPPQTPPAGAGGSGSLGRPAQRRLWLTREHEEARAGGDSFDALTDLFLGEVSRPRRDAGDRVDDAVAVRPLPGPSGPKLRLIPADGIDDEQGGSTTDAVETDADKTTLPKERTPAFIECLVVGNLPVLASAWASQYVREVASAADRPVAYLRVQAGYASLEIVGESNLNGHALPIPIADLDGALRAAAGVTNRWVVRVDQADESVTASRASMRLVTLLTGADEAARVHAYGALKDLAERLPKTAELGPAVRVAVMSAPDTQAEETGRKLVETVRQFLGRDVQHAICSARIKAGRPAQMVFNGRIELPTALIVEKLEHALEVPAERTAILAGVTATPPAVLPASPAPVATPTLAAAPVVVEPKPEPSTVAGAAPIEAVAAPSRPDIAPPVEPEPAAAVAVARPVATARIPAAASFGERRVDDVALWSAAAVEPKSEPAAEAADLASFVAGLKGTRIRCPYAELVEMGVDDIGRLHLMARSSGPAEDDRVIASLMVASAWAESHAMLLQPALPAFSPAAGAAMLHLFTATPKATRRLAETNLRLHLLAPVTVGGQTGWFSTELN